MDIVLSNLQVIGQTFNQSELLDSYLKYSTVSHLVFWFAGFLLPDLIDGLFNLLDFLIK